VLGDKANDPAYDPIERLVHHVGEWLSPWYLPALAVIALIPIDAGVSLVRGRGLGVAAGRAGLLALAGGTMIPMLWLLAGAPWTSLEWTKRHVAPIRATLVSVRPGAARGSSSRSTGVRLTRCWPPPRGGPKRPAVVAAATHHPV
jgi:hypothetical protein